jgi:hypothetical protein
MIKCAETNRARIRKLYFNEADFLPFEGSTVLANSKQNSIVYYNLPIVKEVKPELLFSTSVQGYSMKFEVNCVFGVFFFFCKCVSLLL